MRLSEAIMLGSTTCKMVAGDWNSCALGCAGNAVGIEQGDANYKMSDGRRRWHHIDDAWPWLSKEPILSWDIWLMFDNEVCEGKKTLEQLADFVRSIEPDCGECNLRKCVCEQVVDEGVMAIEAKSVEI